MTEEQWASILKGKKVRYAWWAEDDYILVDDVVELRGFCLIMKGVDESDYCVSVDLIEDSIEFVDEYDAPKCFNLLYR